MYFVTEIFGLNMCKFSLEKENIFKTFWKAVNSTNN